MPKITKLERQKYNNARVSLYVDDAYAFSLTDEAVIEYGISVGIDVNSLPLERIYDEDQYKQALAKAFLFLSHSMKSERQVRENLIKKEFSDETVERVIERLKELNYIDDFTFAKSFAENSVNSGVNAIKFKLKNKGISDEIINSVLLEFSDDDQLEKAKELIKKQLPKYAKFEAYDKKRKLNEFLYRKGFQWDTIKSAIDEVLSGEDE